MRRIIDNHVHSSYSPDSRIPLASMARAAQQAGLSGVAVTDHFDFDVPEGVDIYVFDPELQQQEIDRIRPTLSPDFQLLKGIEIGMQPQSMDAVRKVMSAHTFDTVIGSIHYLDGTDPYRGEYYELFDNAHSAYAHYLETLFECFTLWDDFDIMGHFDYVARYAPYKEHTMSLSSFEDLWDTLLKKLAYEGKTFEINTKTYKPFAHGTPLLDENVLRRFRELGADAVSLGSDAHDASRLGDSFDFYVYLLQKCGFKYSVYYKGRKPYYEKL